MTTARTSLALLLAAGMALSTSACGPEQTAADPITSTATVNVPRESTTPAPTASEVAFARSLTAAKKWAALPPTGHVAGDFLTPEFIKSENAGRDAVVAAGAHLVNPSPQLLWIKPVDYRATPAPVTTLRACSEGDVRVVDKDGRDITYDSKGNPVPKGVKRTAVLVQLTTPDAGTSWQVNSVQSEGPC